MIAVITPNYSCLETIQLVGEICERCLYEQSTLIAEIRSIISPSSAMLRNSAGAFKRHIKHAP